MFSAADETFPHFAVGVLRSSRSLMSTKSYYATDQNVVLAYWIGPTSTGKLVPSRPDDFIVHMVA